MKTNPNKEAAPVGLGAPTPSGDRCKPSLTRDQENTSMTHESDNPYSVAATLPAGFMTDDKPDAELRTYAGTPHAVAGRPAAAYAVVIVHRDGQISDDFVTVEVGEAQRDLSLAQARQFASAITRAADDLLAADPANVLDTVNTAAIIDEITRRVSGPDALRAVLAAADPAALTRADRSALLDLFNRAMDAAFAAAEKAEPPAVDTSRDW